MGDEEVAVVHVHGSAFQHQVGALGCECVRYRDANYAAAGGVGRQGRNLVQLFISLLLIVTERGDRDREREKRDRKIRKPLHVYSSKIDCLGRTWTVVKVTPE